MLGQLSSELKISAEASQVWEIISTLKLAKLVVEEIPDVVTKFDVVEGDGGVGTVLKLYLSPDGPGFSSYSEKFTKVDHEKLVKETEVVEGGVLDIGFTKYLIRFEVIDKGEGSCIWKSTIEYEMKEEFAANASLVSIKPLESIMETVEKWLTNHKA
ncbi:Bet v I/Major latex protein [Dillenia turbinata]|uniref:Bet v I/Major latex protein n=1 Tax=Dillenia turbinata TaxID=194707 RepID=A0AAN8VB94_9MAGN